MPSIWWYWRLTGPPPESSASVWATKKECKKPHISRLYLAWRRTWGSSLRPWGGKRNHWASQMQSQKRRRFRLLSLFTTLLRVSNMLIFFFFLVILATPFLHCIVKVSITLMWLGTGLMGFLPHLSINVPSQFGEWTKHCVILSITFVWLLSLWCVS